MKKIELFVGEKLFTDGKNVFKNDGIFFKSGFNINLKRFSVIVLYARDFNLENCKKIIDLYSFLQINDIVFVLGNEREKLLLKEELSYSFLPWIRVGINQNFSDVLYSSLKVGLRAVSRRTEFIVLQFGTMARLKKETIHRLIEDAQESKSGIAIPVWRRNRGHPIIFSHKFLPILLSLRKEKGLPFLLRHYGGMIREIPVQDENILKK